MTGTQERPIKEHPLISGSQIVREPTEKETQGAVQTKLVKKMAVWNRVERFTEVKVDHIDLIPCIQGCPKIVQNRQKLGYTGSTLYKARLES